MQTGHGKQQPDLATLTVRPVRDASEQALWDRLMLVRLRGRFLYQPQAHRHYAARQGEALREVLTLL